MNPMSHINKADQSAIHPGESADTNISAVQTPEDGGLRLIVSGSLRENRTSSAIASWAAGLAESTPSIPSSTGGNNGVDASPRQKAFMEVSVLDLAEMDLPDDRLLVPGGGQRTQAAEAIEASDAFIFVSPEYNHSYPAGLKRFIDWHYSEWAFKAATIISYGVRGGYAAAEHLRGIFAELNLIGTRRALGLNAPWVELRAGAYEPEPDLEVACVNALAELAWWSSILRQARRDRPFER